MNLPSAHPPGPHLGPAQPFLPIPSPAASPHYLMPKTWKEIAVTSSPVFLHSLSLPPTPLAHVAQIHQTRTRIMSFCYSGTHHGLPIPLQVKDKTSQQSLGGPAASGPGCLSIFFSPSLPAPPPHLHSSWKDCTMWALRYHEREPHKPTLHLS